VDACSLLRFTLYFFHAELGGNGFGILIGVLGAEGSFSIGLGGSGLLTLGIVAFSSLGCCNAQRV
jgi:hypothetical protein